MSPPRGDSLSVCLERASTSDFSTSAIRPFRSLTGFERKGDFAADNGSVVLGRLSTRFRSRRHAL